MKKILLVPYLLLIVVAAHAQTNRAGTIAQIKGNDVTVKNENPQSPFQTGEKLRLLTGDKTIELEVVFPMQTSSRCKMVSGSVSSLRPGMIVYSGGEPVKGNADQNNQTPPERKRDQRPEETGPIKIDDFSTFLGFSGKDTIDTVIAKLGKPSRIDDLTSIKYEFDAAFWDDSSANHLIRISFWRDTRKIYSISIYSLSGDDEGEAVQYFLATKGITDKRENFIGEHVSTILSAFGQPESSDSDNYTYTLNVIRGDVNFICYDFNQQTCSTITVYWYRGKP